MAKVSIERENFSQRLQQTLRNAHHSFDSPTELARNFNLRFSGPPITVHAARKWLVGEAIPTQEKMRTLAQWLGVSLEWLRFGGDEQPIHSQDATRAIKSEDLQLMSDFQLLDEHYRQIARELMRILIRISREASPGANAQTNDGPIQ